MMRSIIVAAAVLAATVAIAEAETINGKAGCSGG